MKLGILFDLDGTLLDTLEDLLDATNYALTEGGYPTRTLAELRTFVGNGAFNQIRLCLPEGSAQEEIQRILDIYKPYYTAHCQHKTAPYPGILEAIESLGQEFPLAIVSNKPDAAVKNLCAHYFPGVYALGEAPDCPRKPAPDMLFRALEALGVDQCIYVGDSEVDVFTARSAFMPCLTVLWGFRDQPELKAAGAEHFCANPAKLCEKIREMAGDLHVQ